VFNGRDKMKKSRVLLLLLLSLLLLLLLPVVLTGCDAGKGPDPVSSGYMPYKDIPQGYTLEDAKADNLVVYEDLNITAGQTLWDSFVEKAGKGEASFIRLAFYYTLGDPSHYSPEYYDEIKDDYPALYIQDLSFDGSVFTLYSIEDGKEYAPQYKYLRHFTEDSPPATAIFTKREMYLLVNDENATWEQINQGMLSSQAGDFIDFKTVYSKYTYK